MSAVVGGKLFTNLAAVLGSTVLGYGTCASSLSWTKINEEFLKPPHESLITSYGYQNHHNNILKDKHAIAKNYLMKNSFSLYWGNKQDSIDASAEISNGFLLNLLSDDKGQQSAGPYQPNWQIESNEIHFLIGTSLSFAFKLFDNVDRGSSVNDVSSAYSLSSQSSKKDTHALKISQTRINKTDNSIQPINFLESPSSSENFKDNHYITLDNSKVELVYVAADLSVSEDAMNLNVESSGISDEVKALRNKNHNFLKWKDKIEGFEEKFAVDFAVIKVSIPIHKLIKEHKHHLKSIYEGINTLNRIENATFKISNNKLGKINFAGYKKLNIEDQQILKLDQLSFQIKIKSDKFNDVLNKMPSEMKSQDWKTYFELSWFQNAKDIDVTLMSDYELVDVVFKPQDSIGVLIVEYKIKNKTKDFIIQKTFRNDFKNLKVNGTSWIDLKNIDLEPILDDLQYSEKYQSFTQKPTPMTDWHEHHSENNYLWTKNFYNVFKERSYGPDKNLNLTHFSNKFKIKDTEYVNISHRANIPYKKHENFKGSMALTHKWNQTSDWSSEILGIYEGYQPITNMFNNENYISAISLLISPFRYDLVNENNNFSKPSLADVLRKKSLKSKLIGKTVFRISTGN